MARVVRLTSRLWAEYTRQVRAGRRLPRGQAQAWQRQIDELVMAHLDLVERIARQVWRRYTRAGQDGYTSRPDMEDMVSCGYVGLMEAARRYSPEKGDFPKFAFRRIRGAIVDAHRRGAYRDMQHVPLEVLLPRDDESAAGPTGTRGGGSAGNHFELLHLVDRSPGADETLAAKELQTVALRAIRRLDPDERLVLIDALRGVPLEDTAAGQGRSPAWARQRLASARETVAMLVKRDQRVA